MTAARRTRRLTRSTRRRGLGFRIAATFALGGLLLSASLAVLTYALADRYLLSQRERTATRQSYLNARALRSELEASGADVTAAISGLEIPPGSSVVLTRDGEWFSSSVTTGRRDVPEGLRAVVADGRPARQLIDLGGTPTLVIGLPVPAAEASYFEVIRFEELADTLGVIRRSLLGGAVATTVGAALLGIWAGRRVLRPLREVSHVASEISSGELQARLESGGDDDLDRLAGSFNRMVDALQERIERERRFVSDVSHELRSPLTTLVTAAQVLETRRAELPERSREALDLILDEIRRFEELVGELLELSRVEAGVEQLELEDVMVGELVLHLAAGADGPPFTVTIPPDSAALSVRTDKRRLSRILANLMENAQSHGHGVVEVGVRRQGDGWVAIHVDDAGPGVPAEDRERIFERFFRGGAAGQRGHGSGAGLGLALVAEHVRLLGGGVLVEDAPGSDGARFVVRLPTRPS